MSFIVKGIDLPKDEVITFHYLNEQGEMVIKIIDKSDAIQIDRPHGRLKDFDGNGIHPIIVDGVYMIRVDDLDEMPTILEAEE